MKPFLILIFTICSSLAIAQSYKSQEAVFKIIENRDTSALIETYEKWSINSFPIEQENLAKQFIVTQETYSIYPAIVKYFCDKTSLITENKNVYILVNNSINIDISSKNLNLDSIYVKGYKDSNPSKNKKRMKFPPRISDSVADNFEKEAVANGYLDASLYTGGRLILNDFRPFISGMDSSFKMIYENESEEYLKIFENAMRFNNVKRSLNKSSASNDKINEDGSRNLTNEVTEEIYARKDFCYPFRLNIKDRVERIIFQPNFRTAFVSYRDDFDVFGMLYFEKVDSKWEFKEVYFEQNGDCTECNRLPIR